MNKRTKRSTLPLGLACISLGVFLLLWGLARSPGSAAAAPLAQGIANESCLFCHQNESLSVEIGGQPLHLFIDGEQFNASVHAQENIACVDCHSNITTFPHPVVTAGSPRAFTLELYPSCQQCHAEQYQLTLDSVHQKALAAGNTNAAVCTDCHNPHTQTRLTSKDTGELLLGAKFHIPQTCAQCHSAIYDTYKASVHGSALTEEGNQYVPTCIDCHGVHNIGDPTANTFRNSTPGLCAECHTNQTLMSQYGLSTNVLDTYVADFHGTTVKIFDELYPDQPTNKPVCTDCHGIHDIMRVDDPKAGIAFQNNLLGKCQQCHPDATTESFTASWLSHYEPSPQVFPLVYYVNLFYQIFIPTVLGGMIFYVLTDIYRRFIVPRLRRKGAQQK
jgi:nitrate/TMAO reductase-like tetraheme cytochrome c subunit